MCIQIFISFKLLFIWLFSITDLNTAVVNLAFSIQSLSNEHFHSEFNAAQHYDQWVFLEFAQNVKCLLILVILPNAYMINQQIVPQCSRYRSYVLSKMFCCLHFLMLDTALLVLLCLKHICWISIFLSIPLGTQGCFDMCIVCFGQLPFPSLQ